MQPKQNENNDHPPTRASQHSLKKHAGSSGGGTTEHIVYADHSGGHGGDGYRRNTFRSMGPQFAGAVAAGGVSSAEPTSAFPYAYEASEELRDRDIRYMDAFE